MARNDRRKGTSGERRQIRRVLTNPLRSGTLDFVEVHILAFCLFLLTVGLVLSIKDHEQEIVKLKEQIENLEAKILEVQTKVRKRHI